MARSICVHGHFYQPPRENPWLEMIEVQDSAAPYHDWNERISEECYTPNAVARILDEHGRIVRIANNYERISFNFGPTLLAWMEDREPETYKAVLEADKAGARRFSGHGPAIAQVYNHMIMPLANTPDKVTQVVWGIADFEHRFGRRPEGMWLAETAVDTESLEVLAEHGIAYTILSPYQAARVRPWGTEQWSEVAGGRIDPTRAYRVQLPSGRSIAVFFYDGPISRAIAFEGLLDRGEHLAGRLVGAFAGEERDPPQLVHIATDGETYGHHHRFGEMALAYALQHIESEDLAKLTVYGEYLERFPPRDEVQIIERTAWSCAHGVERWNSDCGCNTGGRPGWNQGWRRPLREALDFLRDTLGPSYEDCARPLLNDPWLARDRYISVVLDRSAESVAAFFAAHAARHLSAEDEVRVLKLLEMQRHLLLMYTSCGWFFDELSGIETVQVIMYAGRALQLARDVLCESPEHPPCAAIERRFLELLAEAKSNLPEHGDGRRIYEKWVRPAMIDPARVAAHYAVSALFTTDHKAIDIGSYDARPLRIRRWAAGRASLAIGRAHIASRVTRESGDFDFTVLHLGDHNFHGGVQPARAAAETPDSAPGVEAVEPFDRADFPAVIRAIDRAFPGQVFSLQSLFRDDQRRILDSILASTREDAEETYRGLYEQNAPLLRFLANIGSPIPAVLATAATVTINAHIRRALAAEQPDVDHVRSLVAEGQRIGITLDGDSLGFALKAALGRLLAAARGRPNQVAYLTALDEAVLLAKEMPFAVDLGAVQNRVWELVRASGPFFTGRATEGDANAQAWLAEVRELAEHLGLEPAALMEGTDHDQGNAQP